MTLIAVPKPKNAYDPSRPVNALLKAQMEHLHQAERRLPSRYRSEIYLNAIRTEGEAAQYIRAVTEAIHAAHQDAATLRAKAEHGRKRGLKRAAAANSRSRGKRKKSPQKESRKAKPRK